MYACVPKHSHYFFSKIKYNNNNIKTYIQSFVMKKRISKKEVSLFQDKLFCMYYLYTTNSKTQSNTDQFLYGFRYATELMGITMSLGPVKIRIFPCQSVGDCLFIYF